MSKQNKVNKKTKTKRAGLALWARQKPAKSLVVSKIHTAIHLVGNNKLSRKSGGVCPKHLVSDDMKTDDNFYDPSALAMAQAFIGLDTIYEFRLVSAGLSLTVTGGGILGAFQTADPSGAGSWTATEWASLIALFSEVRMKSFTVHFVRALNTGIAAAQGMAISGVLSTVGSAPTTYSQVYDNADATIWAAGTDTSAHGYKHTIRGTDLTWAIVTTPNPGAYAGCPGSIQYYTAGMTAGVTFGQYHLSGIYAFRSRI